MNKNKAFLQSALSLAVAANIGAGILNNITGNAVGTIVEGKTVTRRSALTLFISRLTLQAVATREVGSVVGILPDDDLLCPVFDTAASLVEGGVTLKTVENTPINMIHTEAMRAVNSMTLTDNGTLGEVAQQYAEVVNSLLYGGASESAVFATCEEVIQLGTKATAGLTSLCQAHVNPFINEALASVRKRFQTLYLDQSNAYAVRENYLHPLLTNDVFIDHVESFAKEMQQTAAFAPMIGMEVLTTDFASALLLTGINSFDSEIQALVDNDKETIQIVRDRIAAGTGLLSRAFPSVDRGRRSKELLVAFLLLRSMSMADYTGKLKDAGYSTEEIATARLVINNVLGQIARMVFELAKNNREEVKNKLLVIGFGDKDGRRTIEVNGLAYQNFLVEVEKEGLGIDVESLLLAALFTNNRNVIYAADIISGKDRLADSYRRHRSEMDAATQNRIRTSAQQAVYQGIRGTMSSALSSYETARAYALTAASAPEEYTQDPGSLISSYSGRVSDELEKRLINGPDDFETAVLVTICNVFYPDTDALKFFGIYDGVGRHMPEADAREIASVAAIEYLSLWLSSQFKYETSTV